MKYQLAKNEKAKQGWGMGEINILEHTEGKKIIFAMINMTKT